MVIAGKTKFMALKQEKEKPIINFLHWLQDISRFFEFEHLEKEEMSIEEELIELLI